MKKSVILTALALPLAFAACNQDEFDAMEQQGGSQEVVESIKGAKVAGHGMEINLVDEASTRLNAQGWENGDRLGIGWVTAHDDFAKDTKLSVDNIKSFILDSQNPIKSSLESEPDYVKYRYALVTYVKKGTKGYFKVSYDGNNGTKTYHESDVEGGSGILESMTANSTCIAIKEWDVDAYQSHDGKFYSIAPVAGIAQEQYPIDWSSFVSVTDHKLYANDMFEYNGSSFSYNGDIYEGAHFAYWPFKRLNKISELTFELNNSQNMASAEEFYLKNASAISAMDSINARNANGDFTTKERLSMDFAIVRLSNAISVNTKFIGNENVEGMKISKVEVSTGAQKVFRTKADFNPHKLPVAVYDNSAFDYESTMEKMTAENLFGTDKAFSLDAPTSTLTATPAIDMPVSTNNTFAMLTYPTATASVTVNDMAVKFYVSEGKNEVGYFEVEYDDENLKDENVKANNNNLSKLAQLLSGGYTLNGKTYSLQELNAAYFNIPLTLNMSMYTSIKEWNVTDVTSWNKAVEAIDALNLTDATIKLNGNIAFTTVAPKFPKTAKLKVNGDDIYTMTINKELSATINKDVKNLNFVVMSGATLTVAEGATVNGTIRVDGILNMNGKAEGNINITKSAYHAGVVNLGAKGWISGNVTNANVINVTEGTANKITETVSGGKVIAIVTNGANAANINSNVKATDITFAGATVNNVDLNADITYTTTGATVFKGNLGSGDAVNLTVKDGTLTFADDAAFKTSGTVTINSGATMIVATGNNLITMSKVVNNGTVELQKSSKGKVTIWNAPEVTGSGSVVLNGNTHNKN